MKRLSYICLYNIRNRIADTAGARLLLVCIFIIAANTAFSQTWTGVTSTDWNVGANWSTLVVPSSSSDVTIPTSPTGGRFPVIRTGTQAVKTLIIQSGATVTQTGGTLVVTTWRNSGTYSASAGTVEFFENGENSVNFYSGANNLFHVVVRANANPNFSFASGSKIDIAGNFTNNNVSLPAQSSNFTLTFNGTGDQVFHDAAPNKQIGNIVIDKASGVFSLNTSLHSVNFTLAAGSVSTTASNYGLTIPGNAEFNGGSFNMNSSSVSVSGNWTNNGCNVSGQSATINVTGNYTRNGGSYNAPPSTITVSGNWTNNSSGVFSAASVSLDGPSSGTAKVIGGSVATAFPELLIKGLVTMNNSNSCASLNLSPSTGTTFTLADGTTLTVNNSVTVDQPTANDKTIALNINAATLSAGGDVLIGNTSNEPNRNTRIAITTGTFNIGGNLVYRSVSASAAALNITGSGIVHLKGNINLANGFGTLSPGTSGTVNFNGSSAQTINFASALRYNNILINNPAGVTPGALPSSFTAITSSLVSGDIRVQSGVLNNGGFAIAGASGKVFEVANGATFNITGTSGMVTGFGTKLFGATSTVNYAGTDQTISLESYGHLTLSGSGAKTMPSSAMTLAGNFTTAGTITTTAREGLTINGSVLLGSGTSFNAGAFTHRVGGNWTNNGATFTPATSTVVLNGSSDQTLGGTVSTLSYNNLTVNKSSGTIVLSTSITVNATLTFTAGRIRTESHTVILPAGAVVSGAGQSSGWVHGRLQKNFATGSGVSRVFEVGGGNNYTPLTVNISSVTTAGNLVANTATPDHPQIANSGILSTKSVNRYYTIASSGIVFTSATITFNWVSGDVDAGANTANFTIRRLAAGTWSTITPASPAATSIQATGVTSFGDFVIGEISLTTTWTGAVSTSWGTSGNWNNGLPVSTSDVVVPGGITNYPVLSSETASLQNLSVQAGASLTINDATLRISGSITNSGTITATNGTIEMTGTAAQTIPANAFSNNTLRSLTINNSAGVSLGGQLNITDVLTVAGGSFSTGGFLTLKSSATTTARVAPVTSSAANPITGKVTVERYVQGRRKYRLITSPVTTSSSAVLSAAEEALSIWGAWQNSGNNSVANQGTFITGGTAADGFDTQTPNASLFSYDGVNRRWVGYTSANGKNTKYTPLKAGEAYLMFVYGDRRNTITTSAPNPTVLKASGTLVTGDQTYTTTSPIPISGVTGQYTLLGNPFASPINWASLPKTNIEDTYWGWDPNLSAQGGYITVTTLGSTTIVAPYSGSVGLDQYIQSGQGFFVRTSGAAPQLTIREQDKVGNYNTSAFGIRGREEVYTGAGTLQLLAVNLWYDNGGTKVLADGVVAAFHATFSSAVGKEDAGKMTNAAEVVAITNGSELLSIEGRPLPAKNEVVALNMSRLKKPQYTLQIFTQNFTEATGVLPFLEDKYLKTSQPLNLKDTNWVVFEVNTADTASFDANRFQIVFKQAQTPPVVFAEVNAIAKEAGVEVRWQVTGEGAIEKYEVERMVGAGQYVKLGEVKPTSSSNASLYQWLDRSPVVGDNHYRIRSLEHGGRYSYSKVVVVKWNEAGPSLRAYPNPVTGQIIQLHLHALQKGTYKILLYNGQGQQVTESVLVYDGMSSTYSLPLKSKLPHGLYFLKVVNSAAIIHTQSLIIN